MGGGWNLNVVDVMVWFDSFAPGQIHDMQSCQSSCYWESPSVLPESEASLTYFHVPDVSILPGQRLLALNLPQPHSNFPLHSHSPSSCQQPPNHNSLSIVCRHDPNKLSPSTATSSHTNMPPKAAPGAPTLSAREMELLQNYLRCVKTKPEVRHPTQTHMPVEQ